MRWRPMTHDDLNGWCATDAGWLLVVWSVDIYDETEPEVYIDTRWRWMTHRRNPTEGPFDSGEADSLGDAQQMAMDSVILLTRKLAKHAAQGERL
jgi:hypothetical protein